MLTLWEILEQLCNGGFLVESFQPDAASRVGLYRWCDGYCAELTAIECLSEYDVCNVHMVVSFLFQSLVMLMFDMSA